MAKLTPMKSMTHEEAWRDGQEILQLVKNHIWTPEVFERCRNSDLINPCIFNLIRQVLEPDEYQQWDEAYCAYVAHKRKK